MHPIKCCHQHYLNQRKSARSAGDIFPLISLIHAEIQFFASTILIDVPDGIRWETLRLNTQT